MANLSAQIPLDGAGDGVDNSSVGDYIALMKPRLMSLVLFTSFVGLMVAPGTIHPVIAFAALLCIAIGAGASGALNMWYDADIDARMQRTAARPIPRGRIDADEALSFGTVMSVGAVLSLGVMVNWVSAALLAFTIFYYVFVYTMWLKRVTPQNIVIGGAAGAFPPMIGWAGVTGSVSLESIILFLIIFMWTPPHFWAMALYRTRDYKRAGIPMLPVVAGPDETRRQILIYAILLVPTTLAPTFVGFSGVLYGASALALGGGFLALVWRVFNRREGAVADRAAKRLFIYSIFYLFALFAMLLADKMAG